VPPTLFFRRAGSGVSVASLGKSKKPKAATVSQPLAQGAEAAATVLGLKCAKRQFRNLWLNLKLQRGFSGVGETCRAAVIYKKILRLQLQQFRDPWHKGLKL